MSIAQYVIILLAATILAEACSGQQHALQKEQDVLDKGRRVRRQTSADQMVQNILQWLQGMYTHNTRKIRQGTLRQYLPPINTQRPRPFQTITPTPQPTVPGGGYPPAGSTPKPPFPPIYTSPGGVTGGGYPIPVTHIIPPIVIPDYTGYPSVQPPQPPFEEPGSPSGPSTGYPETQKPGFATGPPPGFTPSQQPTGYPTQRPTGYPTQPSTGYPTQPPTGYPTQPPTGYPTGPSTSYPSYPSQPPTGYPTQPTGYPTQPTGYPTQSTGYPTQSPTQPATGYPTQPTGYPTQPPTQPPTPVPSTSPPAIAPTEQQFTSAPGSTGIPPGTEENTIPPGPSTAGPPTDDDLNHPPHIHAIDVECAKDMMTINIEFNRQYDGIIYSKGYYNNPECRYVQENSGQTKYTFTVSLNSCGTEFINAFDTQGQSYLENVLVLQNEPGIQEVWDTIRAVRCLWEGNLKESLSVALSVGMLAQEIVTFSGDTAMAKLDIQLGRGPFAPPANGLVKIGETMTLVVSVSGDPGFDVQVKDCRARDSTGENVVALTDENGCVLKPKLFGAFQKTRNTENTGASIIAYAFFNAFKFPDIMDLMIECNIELCKTDCQMCPDPDQKIEPGKRRRRDISDLYYHNETIGDSVTMGKHLRVILPEDLSDNMNSNTVLHLSSNEGVCMSTQNFVYSSAIMISLLATSCLFSTYIWFKYQRLALKQ